MRIRNFFIDQCAVRYGRPWRHMWIIVAFALLFVVELQTTGQSQAKRPSIESASPEALRTTRLEIQDRLRTAQKNGEDEAAPDVRSLEERLLQALSDEEDGQAAVTDNTKGGKGSKVQVPVLYATDRQRVGRNFGGELSSGGGLELGKTASVFSVDYGVNPEQVPGAKRRQGGASEKMQESEDRLSHDAFWSDARSRGTLVHGRKPLLLLFVHGYRTSFAEAIERTARLATELQLPVVPMAYSWPSSGSTLGYWHDEDRVRASSLRFGEFLKDLLRNSPLDVLLVCHSMGCREVSSALSDVANERVDARRLRWVAFTAADVFTQEFRERWPAIRSLPANFAFYASDGDRALAMSTYLHWVSPRLGYADTNLWAPPGGMTINASNASSIFDGIGHSYLVDNPKVGSDIASWVGGVSPDDRGMVVDRRRKEIIYIMP